jgi:hypothetical protein
VTAPAAAYSISFITGDRNRHIDSEQTQQFMALGPVEIEPTTKGL